MTAEVNKEMKYVIMCGGDYKKWSKPRQLTEINGEPIIARTIRLLRECGVEDIAISANNNHFNTFGVPVLRHINEWVVYDYEKDDGTWCNAFYPTDEPVCYLLGDVVFSKAAIRTIVNTQTNDIAFFASAPPFAKDYPKEYAEPFGFKVVNLQHFWNAIRDLKRYENEKLFKRHPIAWELWQVIKGTELNTIDYKNYTVINDYTCDIDVPEDIKYYTKLNIGD